MYPRFAWRCCEGRRCESSRGVAHAFLDLWNFILRIWFSFTLFRLIGHSQRQKLWTWAIWKKPISSLYSRFSRVWSIIKRVKKKLKQRPIRRVKRAREWWTYGQREVINRAPWNFHRSKMKFNIKSEASAEICNSKIDAFRHNLLLNAREAFLRLFFFIVKENVLLTNNDRFWRSLPCLPCKILNLTQI